MIRVNSVLSLQVIGRLKAVYERRKLEMPLHLGAWPVSTCCAANFAESSLQIIGSQKIGSCTGEISATPVRSVKKKQGMSFDVIRCDTHLQPVKHNCVTVGHVFSFDCHRIDQLSKRRSQTYENIWRSCGPRVARKLGSLGSARRFRSWRDVKQNNSKHVT